MPNPNGGAVSSPTYASFLSRVLAAVIDTVVLFLPTLLVVLVLEPEFFSAGEKFRGKSITYAALAALWAGYQGGMESTRYQATLGKLAVRAYVTDLRGNRLSFTTAAYRCWPMYILNVVQGVQVAIENVFRVDLGGAIYFGAFVTILVSCLYILWSPKNQGLHDQMLGTLVLKR
jgi:uncharacterized RDD family membrane protein YckC